MCQMIYRSGIDMFWGRHNIQIGCQNFYYNTFSSLIKYALASQAQQYTARNLPKINHLKLFSC